MKNMLHSMSGISRCSLTILGILVFMTAGHAQKLFEIRSVRQDLSLLGNDIGQTDFPIVIGDANGAERAQWQFVHVKDQYYQIVDKNGVFAIYNNGVTGFAWNKSKQNSDDFLWELVDADGRGDLFFLRSKLNNRVFTPEAFFSDVFIYMLDSIDNGNTDLQHFRLVDRGGSGDNPKDSKGNEIFPQVDYTAVSSWNTVINMYIKTRSLCAERPAYEVYKNGQTPPRDDKAFLDAFDVSQYSLLESNQKSRIYVNARTIISITLNHPDNEMSMINPFENWESEIDRDSLKLEFSHLGGNGAAFWFRGAYDYDLELGTPKMFISAHIQERALNGVGVGDIFIQAPGAVSGIVDKEVPVLGTITTPKIPYMVLHAPPGDKSFSEFQNTKKICRKFEETYTQDKSTSAFANLKIGAKGSIGVVATVDFEISYTYETSGKVGELMVSKNSKEACLSTTTGFRTSALADTLGDVFIGYGYDSEYGQYRVVQFLPDSCKIGEEYQLVLAVLEDSIRDFAWTESRILQDIDELRLIEEDLSYSEKSRFIARGQRKAWEEVLAKNNENKQMAQPKGNPFSLQGNGAAKFWEERISVASSNSINTELYIDGTVGLKAKVEIAGSGVEGGISFNSQKKFGETNEINESDEQMIKYSLEDDDAGDEILIQEKKDPMYGTPVFEIVERDTRTSCPYEAGKPRDVPRLTYDLATSDSLVVTGVPTGQDAVFNLMICNDSDEARTYSLKLDDDSNASLNARVIAGGTEINNNPRGREYSRGPGECREVEIIVQQINQNRLNYPRLEFTLTPTCAEENAISSNLFVSVYFDKGTAVNDIPALSGLNIYPNPSFGEFNVDFTLDEPETVVFEIYDLTGRLIRSTAQEQLGSGNHLRTFGLDGVHPGVYHFSIKAASGVISRRIVVQ